MALIPIHFIPKNTVGIIEKSPEIFWTKTRKECVDGSWEESTYDRNGNQLSHKRSAGYSWNSTYDQNNNKLSFKDNSEYYWNATYDQNNKQLTFSDSEGYSWESVYDQNGKQIRHSDSKGYSIEYFRREDGTPFYREYWTPKV
jgi:hypothetical protein